MQAGEAQFLFARPKAGVLVVTIAGYDKGQLGTAPHDELGAVLRVAAPIELFIDARNAVGVTVRVSEDWTRFLSRHRAELGTCTCSPARKPSSSRSRSRGISRAPTS